MPVKYQNHKEWLHTAEPRDGRGPHYFLVKESNRYLVAEQSFNQAGEHHHGVIWFDDKAEAIEWMERKVD